MADQQLRTMTMTCTQRPRVMAVSRRVSFSCRPVTCAAASQNGIAYLALGSASGCPWALRPPHHAQPSGMRLMPQVRRFDSGSSQMTGVCDVSTC